MFLKQTKVKPHFLRRSEKSKKKENEKDDERTIFEIFLKNQIEIQKNKFTRLEQAKKKKKDETKKEKKNWRGFTERDEKRKWKRIPKRNMNVLQK